MKEKKVRGGKKKKEEKEIEKREDMMGWTCDLKERERRKEKREDKEGWIKDNNRWVRGEKEK